MGGFLAVVDDGPTDARALRALTTALSYRGTPTVFLDGVTLVAFERPGRPGLAVADDLVVAADIRIHNRAELDPVLCSDGANDAEVLLAAWRRWDLKALDRIVGDFAGAVWDRRERRLTIVRDPIGARPAILARAGSRVLAGSSLAGLIADPAFHHVIDDSWVASYLGALPEYATATGYRDASRLTPGYVAEMSSGGWRTRRWFRWRAPRARMRDDAAYAERFRELFDEAVRCRIDGAQRVGIMLSGGLDSTSVAVTARAVRPDADLVAICLPFEDRKGDERALQRLIAERVGARMRWAPMDGANPFGLRGASSMFETLGVPTVPPNRFHAELTADAGADEDVQVALDGIDGDGITGGNWYFLADLLVRGRFRTWLREAKATRSLHGARLKRLFRMYSVKPLVPPVARSAYRRLRGHDPVPAFVDRRFARRQRLRQRMDADRWAPIRAFRAVERMSLEPGVVPLVMELLNEEWERRGIEIAHPFMDRRLISFCLGLPRTQKIRGGLTKIVLRGAMRGRLPAAVAERADKAELSLPFFAGLSGAGATELSEGLSSASSNDSSWLDPDGVARLREKFSERTAFEAFRVAAVALWGGWVAEQRRAAAGFQEEPVRPYGKGSR